MDAVVPGSQRQLFMEGEHLLGRILHHLGESGGEDSTWGAAAWRLLRVFVFHIEILGRGLWGDGDGGDLQVRVEAVQLSHLLQLLLAGALREAADLQRLRRLDEGGKHVLRHVGLPFVHIFHQTFQVVEIHIFHDNYRVLVMQEGGFEKLLQEREYKNL